MEEKIAYNITTKQHELSIINRYRNYKWMLYAVMGGISFLFLSLTFMYFVSNYKLQNHTLKISSIYFINTFILLASSIVLINLQKYFREDKFKNYKKNILLFYALSLLFLIGQSLAIYQMYTSVLNLPKSNSIHFFSIIGIHTLYLIGGIFYWIYFTTTNWNLLKTYATSIVHFTDPIAKMQLDLFARFWHFLGVIWLYLLFFFLTFTL